MYSSIPHSFKNKLLIGRVWWHKIRLLLAEYFFKSLNLSYVQ